MCMLGRQRTRYPVQEAGCLSNCNSTWKARKVSRELLVLSLHSKVRGQRCLVLADHSDSNRQDHSGKKETCMGLSFFLYLPFICAASLLEDVAHSDGTRCWKHPHSTQMLSSHLDKQDQLPYLLPPP